MQEEQKVWREARSFGDEVDELTKETLEKHLVEPAIKPDVCPMLCVSSINSCNSQLLLI